MKTITTRFYAIAFLIIGICSQAFAQFQFVSPSAASKFNKPQSNIILSFAVGFNQDALHANKFIKVTGSLSGRHEVNITLCENGKTIVLKPIKAFAYSETVNVEVSNGLRSSRGNTIEESKFSFQIQPQYSLADKMMMAEKMKTVYDEDGAGEKKNDQPGGTKAGFPSFTITNNTNPAAGDVLFSNFSIFDVLAPTHYCIIKSNGDSVYGKDDNFKFNNFDLNRNGYFTMFDRTDSDFVMLDSNYYQIDSFQMGNGYTADVHEFQILPDGTHWMICYDPQIVDMSVYNSSYNKNTMVIGCIVQKLDANNNVVFQWRSWDHFSILDADHTDFSSGFVDAVHANAIELDSDGNILLSCRTMCEITKINPLTGAIIWRLGGKNNQFTFINDTEAPMFHFQHDVHRIANGNITMFDNGNFHTPAVSYAKEYTLDEVNKTATLSWSYKRTVASGDVYSIAMGSAQRLSNGNTLICWGLNLANSDNPTITEVDANKNIVWEMELNSADAVYRAHRRDWNPCSRPTLLTTIVKNITSTEAKVDWDAATNAISYDVHYRKSNKTTWKLKTTTNTNKKLKNLASNQNYVYQVRSHCASGDSSGWTPIDTFTTLPLRILLEGANSEFTFVTEPNPFSNSFKIEFKNSIETELSVSIYDVIGILILQTSVQLIENNQTLQFDLTNYRQGVYFVKVKLNGIEKVQKIVKQ